MNAKLLCLLAIIFAPLRDCNGSLRQMQNNDGVQSTLSTSAASTPSTHQRATNSLQNQNEDEEDDSYLQFYSLRDDLSDVNPLDTHNQEPPTLIGTLIAKCHHLNNGHYPLQRFGELFGTQKKYDFLLKLLDRGQLINHINKLNRKNISTGDSLLNEALNQAVQDDKRKELIRLLSETLIFSDKLSTETKQRVDIFLQEKQTIDRVQVSNQVSEYLEQQRLITQIRHALTQGTYQGPDILNMTAAAYDHIQTLTDGVIANNLAVNHK
ncbi:hypothetical protein HYV10_00540 [Candidatus Dependentiae bacterium]|nr:hypothetical protein [Candidatus Dependentiae bacterium]